MSVYLWCAMENEVFFYLFANFSENKERGICRRKKQIRLLGKKLSVVEISSINHLIAIFLLISVPLHFLGSNSTLTMLSTYLKP